ncbi:MAG: HAMP domain-containing sensor histidine kinase, partial [Myxococcota bacterium]
EILGQLLDFSRPPRSMRVELDLHALAEQAAGLVSAQERYDGIAFEVLGEHAGVVADQSIVAQILVNLVLNGADAVAAVAARRVRLTVAPDAEGHVACRVEDTGPGVCDEDRQRIFDPFFTTKPPGEGTGLGLANALRFAEELGGSLDCERSPVRGGASFVLRLPAP